MSIQRTVSPATEALRYGRGSGALRLMDGGLPRVTGSEARWRPLPDGGGLELVDRQGKSSGWALVKLPESEGARR